MGGTPDEILIAVGRGSLFWDVCRLNLDTGKLTTVIQNPMSTWWGILGVVGKLGGYLLAKMATCCTWQGTAPGVPAIQWFPDRNRDFEMRGRIEITLFPELSMHLAVKPVGSSTWRALQTVTFPKLNMQLVGGSAGSGTLRMDFSECGGAVN